MHTTTKNSRTFIFMYIRIPKLMPRHYITDTRRKRISAAAKNFQDDYHAQVAIHCGMARLGPKRQRRREWKAQQEHAMKIAAAGALLDAAAQRRVNAAKQRANADTATVLAEEKRKARDAITQAHEAMQEAKRLQAEANEIRHSRGCTREIRTRRRTTPPTPPQKGAEALHGRVRAMSAYQANALSSIVTSSTTNDSKEAPPAPCSAWGACENEGTPTTSAVHAFGNEQPTGCDHAPAMGCKAKRAAWGGKPLQSWSRAQRLASIYIKENNQGVSR